MAVCKWVRAPSSPLLLLPACFSLPLLVLGGAEALQDPWGRRRRRRGLLGVCGTRGDATAGCPARCGQLRLLFALPCLIETSPVRAAARPRENMPAVLLCTPNPPPLCSMLTPAPQQCVPGDRLLLRAARGPPRHHGPLPMAQSRWGGPAGPSTPQTHPPAAARDGAQRAGSLGPAFSRKAQCRAAASERGEMWHPRAALQRGMRRHRVCSLQRTEAVGPAVGPWVS